MKIIPFIPIPIPIPIPTNKNLLNNIDVDGK